MVNDSCFLIPGSINARAQQHVLDHIQCNESAKFSFAQQVAVLKNR